MRIIFGLMCVCTIVLSSGMSFADTSAISYFKKPEMLSASISPDGHKIVAISNGNQTQYISLIDSDTQEHSILMNVGDFSEQEASVRGVSWIDSQHIAVQYSELRKGVVGLLDTRAMGYLLIIKIPDKYNEEVIVYSVRTKGWLVHPLASQDNVFLYAKSGAHSKVYRIQIDLLQEHKKKLSKLTRIDGGQFKKINEESTIAGYAIRWLFDFKGKPRAVLNYSDEQTLELNSLDAHGDTTVIETWTQKQLQTRLEKTEEKVLIPVAMADEEGSFYCFDIWEEEKKSVYKVNFNRGVEELLYETDAYRILEVIISEEDNGFLGVRVLKDGDIRQIYLNPHDQSVSNRGEKYLDKERILNVKISSSINKNRILIYSESYNEPGQYILADIAGESRVIVGGEFPHLNGRLSGGGVESSIEVEGLEIPYILSLPNKILPKGAPLIVMPHGGPIGIFDDRYFDLTTQFLVLNGYAVLRVNFRGSGGYSTELKQAGKRQWGNLILRDIYKATEKVVADKRVNEERVCVFGASYGGYAALMLTITHPETYLCGVTMAGVSDVNLYLNSPKITSRQDDWLKEYVGDSLTEHDVLKDISPVYSLIKLQRPLLIMHGEKDEVVDIEHFYRLTAFMLKYEKTFESYAFPETGHALENMDTVVLYHSKVLDFLNKYLN